MRILILANNDIGLYKFRKELIQKLLDEGNQLYISLPYGCYIQELESMGCFFIDTDIDRRGINPIADLKLLLKYKKIINYTCPDIVITYTIKPNIYGCMVCRFLHINYAANITGLGTAFQCQNLLKVIVTLMYKISLKKAKVIFFENVENKKQLMDLKVVGCEQSCVLNGAGVNLHEYSYIEYPPEGIIRILFIGRIMKEKGIDDLIKVAERIKEEYNNVIFDIVGPMEDNYKHVFDLLVRKGIINYYGYQDNVKEFIKNCNCFVLPSWHEGMANTNLESAACGRPIITSNIHGCKEAVENEITGYLCEKNNADDLYRVLKKFIELPYIEKKKMGMASRKRMEMLFDREKIISQTIDKLSKGH